MLTTDSVDGMLYYTMPYVAGESLSERVRRVGSLPLEEAVHIWRDVLDALAYAHANGVVHLDVKPGNILLSGRHALVTDFGISRAIETATGGAFSETPGLAVGTPAYMAPEEAAGNPVADPRADIYSAGIVMYEMLAGSGPFAADSAAGYLAAHRTVEPPRPIRPEASQKLLALVMRCLAKDPADRPPKRLDSPGGPRRAEARLVGCGSARCPGLKPGVTVPTRRNLALTSSSFGVLVRKLHQAPAEGVSRSHRVAFSTRHRGRLPRGCHDRAGMRSSGYPTS